MIVLHLFPDVVFFLLFSTPSNSSQSECHELPRAPQKLARQLGIPQFISATAATMAESTKFRCASIYSRSSQSFDYTRRLLRQLSPPLLEVSWYDPEGKERGSILLHNSIKISILASLLFFCAANVKQTLMRFKVRIKAFNSRTSEQYKEPNKHHQSSWYRCSADIRSSVRKLKKKFVETIFRRLSTLL